jgi:hypothetical protein
LTTDILSNILVRNVCFAIYFPNNILFKALFGFKNRKKRKTFDCKSQVKKKRKTFNPGVNVQISMKVWHGDPNFLEFMYHHSFNPKTIYKVYPLIEILKKTYCIKFLQSTEGKTNFNVVSSFTHQLVQGPKVLAVERRWAIRSIIRCWFFLLTWFMSMLKFTYSKNDTEKETYEECHFQHVDITINAIRAVIYTKLYFYCKSRWSDINRAMAHNYRMFHWYFDFSKDLFSFQFHAPIDQFTEKLDLLAPGRHVAS